MWISAWRSGRSAVGEPSSGFLMALLSDLFPPSRLSRLIDPKPGYRWSVDCNAWIPGSAWDTYEDFEMAIDPKANANYRSAKDITWAVGQAVWISGLEFRVAGLTPVSPQHPNGQLILAPVTAKV